MSVTIGSLGLYFNSEFKIGDLVRINRRATDPSEEIYRISEIFYNPKNVSSSFYSYKVTPVGSNYYSVIYNEQELVIDESYRLDKQFREDLKWLLTSA